MSESVDLLTPTDAERFERVCRAVVGDYEHTVRSFENGYITRVVGHEAGVFVTTGGLTMRRSEAVASALVELLQ
jgi:hypothetical protein